MTTSNDAQSLAGLVDEIRDLVNEARWQHLLVQCGTLWNRLCSAMDAVGDAEYALRAHAALSEGESGALYLGHYGFMHALYLQQCAVESICIALKYQGLAHQVRGAIQDVREIRNDVAHMTDRSGGRVAFGINRSSMSSSSFEMYEFGEFHTTRVNCRELQHRQTSALAPILRSLLDRLQNEDREHREQFAGDRLMRFLDRLDFPLQKIAAGASAASDVDLAITGISIDTVDNAINDLEQALRRRERFPGVHRGVDDEMQTARDCIARLRGLFAEGKLPSIDARGLARLLRDTIEHLEKMATEFDEDYAAPK